MKIAPHFDLSEFLLSQTAVRQGLDNTPTAEVLANIEQTLAPGMQRVRECLRVPVLIGSGYRAPAVNRAIGGAANSQHTQGLAADFTAPRFGTPQQIAQALAGYADEIQFDQLIWEGNWVHISFVAGRRRGQVLTAHFEPGGVRYTQGLRGVAQ